MSIDFEWIVGSSGEQFGSKWDVKMIIVGIAFLEMALEMIMGGFSGNLSS